MKIERISENQIRCTLSSFDLSVRDLNLSELAYGSEKARGLFKEMIQKASNEVGFDAEDIPLMVEAIPLSNESVMLVITKIEDPEELDTRFAKFTPSGDDSEGGTDFMDFFKDNLEGADDIMNAFQSLKDGKIKPVNGMLPYPDSLRSSTDKDVEAKQETPDVSQVNLVRIFQFSSIEEVTNIAIVLNDIYWGQNTLYKDELNTRYYLVVNKSTHTPQEFNKVCNILSEYGNKVKNVYATEAYYKEHYAVIIHNSALQILATI